MTGLTRSLGKRLENLNVLHQFHKVFSASLNSRISGAASVVNMGAVAVLSRWLRDLGTEPLSKVDKIGPNPDAG